MSQSSVYPKPSTAPEALHKLIRLILTATLGGWHYPHVADGELRHREV